ncbi:MAG TPA: hypothetical protein VNO43_11295 [Candidatus Eisenbacteria bacterium]|nr:hypothetical protein [Candidatus Eisenbacteria bacterium]
MKKQGLICALIAGSLSLMGGGVHATPIDTNALSLGELQTLFHSRTHGGVSSINVNTDESKAEVFTFQSTGASATYVASVSYTASSLEFGLYDVYRPTERLTLFDTNSAALGSAPGDSTQIFISYNAVTGQATTYSYEVNPGFPPSFTVHDSATFGGSSFGFYLTSVYGTWFSQSELNAANGDVNGDGIPDTDHFLAYMGKGDRFDAQGTGVYLNDFAHWYIAGEATNMAGLHPSFSDFTDFVAQVESVQPLPEAATFSFLAIGLLAVFGLARRRALNQ